MSVRSVAQSCLTFCDPMDCSPPGSSVHGILQTRILEWDARPSSRGSSRPRDWTHVSYVSCIGRWFLTTSATWEVHRIQLIIKKKLPKKSMWSRVHQSVWFPIDLMWFLTLLFFSLFNFQYNSVTQQPYKIKHRIKFKGNRYCIVTLSIPL